MKKSADDLYKKLRDAITKFGEYTFYDKRTWEIMDSGEVKKWFKGMPAKDIADILASLRKKKYGEQFVTDVLCLLDGEGDEGELDPLYEDKRISDLY